MPEARTLVDDVPDDRRGKRRRPSRWTEDVKEACTGANVIYTDIWVSMGEPDELWAERIKLLEPYRVTKEVMAMADKNAIFLHCLPSFHDTKTTIGAEIAEKFGVTEMEVEDDVFEVDAVQGVRRGREPHAQHQGHRVRDSVLMGAPASLAGTTVQPSEKHHASRRLATSWDRAS